MTDETAGMVFATSGIHVASIAPVLNSYIDGFEWEKFTTAQAITSDTGEIGGTRLTNWESTPNVNSFGRLAVGFNPTTGLFTPPESGWYLVSYQVQFAANATGFRRAECSGVHAVQTVNSIGASNKTRLSGAGTTWLDGPSNVTGRFFDLDVTVRQNSGGDLNVTYAALHIVRLALPGAFHGR